MVYVKIDGEDHQTVPASEGETQREEAFASDRRNVISKYNSDAGTNNLIVTTQILIINSDHWRRMSK